MVVRGISSARCMLAAALVLCFVVISHLGNRTYQAGSLVNWFGATISKYPYPSKERDRRNLGMLFSNDQVYNRTQGHHFNHSASHQHAWQHLHEVDGLKNEEVIVVVTSTSTNNGYFLRDRVIPSSRTWMRMFANVLVVIEDTFEMRFAMRNCEQQEYPLYTTFDCHNEPTYLLSRVCTDDYYGAAGPCCKVDDAVNFVVNTRTDLFASIKYMLHCDDDMFWRADQTLRWLAAVENAGLSKYPIVANLNLGDEESTGVWRIEGCEEVRTTGWYQPAMLNHALLARMGAASAAYGVKATCAAFDVTHDIGLGVLAWVLGAYHIHMPQTKTNPDHKGLGVYSPGDMAMHCVKHHKRDRCDDHGENGWPEEDKHNQRVVTGCGDLGHPIKGHDPLVRADMYDAWEYYRDHGVAVVLNQTGVNEFIETYVVVDKSGKLQLVVKEHVELTKDVDGSYEVPAEGVPLIDESLYKLADGERIERRVIPRLMPLRGYRGTQHAKDNDVTKVWKPFTLDDCSPPGKKIAKS